MEYKGKGENSVAELTNREIVETFVSIWGDKMKSQAHRKDLMLEFLNDRLPPAESKQGSHRWVSVEQEPENAGEYNVCQDGKVYSAWYNKGFKHFYMPDFDGMDYKETKVHPQFWQPLPPAPSEEESKPLSEEGQNG